MSVSLIDFFDKAVEANPARPCLIWRDQSHDYRQVQEQSSVVAHALRRGGLRHGAHVAVLAHNGLAAFECVLGVIRAGAAWLPINARGSIGEWVELLNRCDVDCLIFGAAFEAEVEQIAERCPKLSRLVCIERPSVLGTPSLDEFCRDADTALMRLQLEPDTLATLAGSGGTTGSPKGVLATHQTWAFRIAEVTSRLAHPYPIHLVAGPMTHGAGAGALELMALGATHVILPEFDARAVLRAIEEYRVTHMFLPPTALYRLMAEPEIASVDLGSLRYLICGGAPIASERLRDALRIFGPAVHTGYGGTEIGGGVCWHRGADMIDAIASGAVEKLKSCGRASPLVRVEVVDEERRLLPNGEVGEIAVTGYNLASGYYGNKEESRASFCNGTFFTGDLGYKDVDGWVYISDRKKDMIITGGFNVYPSEVEAVLHRHPAVQDCAVVGLPHEYWGEAVTAVIEPKMGIHVDVRELEALCRESLGSYKVPKNFAVWESIPRSAAGKVLKRVVRDHLAVKGQAAGPGTAVREPEYPKEI